MSNKVLDFNLTHRNFTLNIVFHFIVACIFSYVLTDLLETFF